MNEVIEKKEPETKPETFFKKIMENPCNQQYLQYLNEKNLNEQDFAEYASLYKIIQIFDINIKSVNDIKKHEKPDFEISNDKHKVCLEVTSVDSGNSINSIIDRFYKRYEGYLRKIDESLLDRLSFLTTISVYPTMVKKFTDVKLRPSLCIDLINKLISCKKIESADPIIRYSIILYTVEFIKKNFYQSKNGKHKQEKWKEYQSSLDDIIKKLEHILILENRNNHIPSFYQKYVEASSFDDFISKEFKIETINLDKLELAGKLYYCLMDSIINSDLINIQNKLDNIILDNKDYFHLPDYIINDSHEGNQICLIKKAIDEKFDAYKEEKKEEDYRHILAVKLFTWMFSVFEESKYDSMRNKLLDCLNSTSFNKKYFDTIVIIGNMHHNNYYWLFERSNGLWENIK